MTDWTVATLRGCRDRTHNLNVLIGQSGPIENDQDNPFEEMSTEEAASGFYRLQAPIEAPLKGIRETGSGLLGSVRQ